MRWSSCPEPNVLLRGWLGERRGCFAVVDVLRFTLRGLSFSCLTFLAQDATLLVEMNLSRC
jgi:hypothetical protein